jgi:hypothetical protein
VTIALTHTTSVVGYISNKYPDCFVWQGELFEQGSFVVLGRSYRKVKVVGSCGLGKNFIMMKLEEVGKVPDSWVPICRMMVSMHPSPETYQLSFRQCLCLFFLKFFLKNYKDFTDDDEEPSDTIAGSAEASNQTSKGSSGEFGLFDEVDLSLVEMVEAESDSGSTEVEESD